MATLEKTAYTGVFKKKLKDGSTSYFIKYRDEQQKSVRVKVDVKTAKEAKYELDKAKILVAEIKSGKAIAPVKSVGTLNELADEFFKARTNKGNAHDIKNYNRWVRESLGKSKHPIDTLSVERFQGSLISATSARGSGLANATINLITDLVRSMINWGIKHGLIGYVNPFVDLKRRRVSNKRDRWLSEDELELLFGFKGVVLDAESGLARAWQESDGRAVEHWLIPPFGADYMLLLKLAYYTGARPISYLGLNGSDIRVASKDPKSEVYMKPLRVYFSPVKEGNEYEVPVSPKLEHILWCRLLEIVKYCEPSERILSMSSEPIIKASYNNIQKRMSIVFGWLFNGGFTVESRGWMSSSGGISSKSRNKDGSYSTTKHFRQFNGIGGFIDLITDDKNKVIMYTLRHTAASHIVAKTGNILLAKEILNHSTITMTERYAKVADEDRTKAISVL